MLNRCRSVDLHLPGDGDQGERVDGGGDTEPSHPREKPGQCNGEEKVHPIYVYLHVVPSKSSRVSLFVPSKSSRDSLFVPLYVSTPVKLWVTFCFTIQSS